MAQKLFSEKNLYNFTTPFDFGADEHTRQTLLCPSPVLGALRRRWRGGDLVYGQLLADMDKGRERCTK